MKFNQLLMYWGILELVPWRAEETILIKDEKISALYSCWNVNYNNGFAFFNLRLFHKYPFILKLYQSPYRQLIFYLYKDACRNAPWVFPRVENCLKLLQSLGYFTSSIFSQGSLRIDIKILLLSQITIRLNKCPLLLGKFYLISLSLWNQDFR